MSTLHRSKQRLEYFRAIIEAAGYSTEAFHEETGDRWARARDRRVAEGFRTRIRGSYAVFTALGSGGFRFACTTFAGKERTRIDSQVSQDEHAAFTAWLLVLVEKRLDPASLEAVRAVAGAGAR